MRPDDCCLSIRHPLCFTSIYRSIAAEERAIRNCGHISKCGDKLARLCLYEAATVIMTRVKRPLDLKIWAMKIAKRSGTNKARVALARKISGYLAQHLAHWRSVLLAHALGCV